MQSNRLSICITSNSLSNRTTSHY